jgi:glycosyltransferase A (GT-A) superfamily protein (DUF2064 family)
MNPVLTNLVNSLGLTIKTPEGAQKVETLANAYGQQMAASAAQQAVQNTLNPDAIEKAVQQRKQSIFSRPIAGTVR